MPELADRLHRFWDLVIQVWNQGVFGIDISRILIAIGVFLLFMVMRGTFAKLVAGRLAALARHSDTKVDDALVAALEPPLRFVPVILGLFFAIEYMQPPEEVTGLAENLTRSLIAFTIFWSLFRLVDPLAFVADPLVPLVGAPMVEWLVKAVKAAFLFVGSASILEIWGINVAALIAGLGLFGVAVALGAQDMFKNLIAGILILIEKRFENGHWIRVDGVIEGTVERIGFRSTRIRRFDDAPVHVPNTELSDNAVINFSRMNHRRIYWVIGVEYRTTVAQLKRIRDGIEAYLLGDDAFVNPPNATLMVRVDAFGDSSIDIMVYGFTRTTVWAEYLEVKEALAYRVKEIVEDAGTGFAFPSRSLYVETIPGAGEPETFAPPDVPAAVRATAAGAPANGS